MHFCDDAGYQLWYWWVRYSDIKNNSSSHKALAKCFNQAGLKDDNNDPPWDLDKVIETLKEFWLELKQAQKKHHKNCDASLREALEEKEHQVKDADDPKKAKKVAAAIKSPIWKHQTQESYTRIRQVTHPNSGGTMQERCWQKCCLGCWWQWSPPGSPRGWFDSQGNPCTKQKALPSSWWHTFCWRCWEHNSLWSNWFHWKEQRCLQSHWGYFPWKVWKQA